MIHVILEGIGLGLLVSFSLGPSFWAVIQTGIDRGFRWGILLSLGILMSDATFIGIAYLGAANLFSEENKLYIGLIGGVVLISFGIYTYLKKPEILRRRSAKYKTPKAPGALTFLGKGFLMNFANPFVFFFWLAAMGFMSSHTGTEDFERIVLVFFGTTLITIFLSDVMKCYVGERFKRFLRPRIIFWINRGIGIMLMVFGVILILRVLLPL